MSYFSLPFISTHIVKVVARRIEEHLEHNDLNDSYQSTYIYISHFSDIAEALYAVCMYTKPVGDIIKRHNINYDCNADDRGVTGFKAM